VAGLSFCLRHHRTKPVGVDSCESVGWFDLWVALEDAGTVLIDIPAYVDSLHLAVEGVHEGKDTSFVFSFRFVEMECGCKEFVLLFGSYGGLDHFEFCDVFAHLQNDVIKSGVADEDLFHQ